MVTSTTQLMMSLQLSGKIKKVTKGAVRKLRNIKRGGSGLVLFLHQDLIVRMLRCQRREGEDEILLCIFCTIIFSCSLTLKERMYAIVPLNIKAFH